MKLVFRFLKKLFPAPFHDRVFLVGGSVRDHLLGREGEDIDLVAALSPGELRQFGFCPVEASSGAAIHFRHHPVFGKIEVTRLERVTDLEEDLRRRDFTINAMAMDLQGKLIDPLRGSRAVEDRILLPCGPSAFRDDPIRVFRAFRFATAGCQISENTGTLLSQERWSGRFTGIPVERFTQEMLKALRAGQPGYFFELMLQYGAGGEYLPELFRMPAIPAGPVEHHPEGDLLTHALQVLERVAYHSENPLARFCALFHDLGKLATEPALYPKHHGHDEAGFTAAAPFCDRLRLPAAYRRALAWVSRLHGNVNRWGELRDATRIRIAEQALKAGIGEILPLVSAADKPGSLPFDEWELALTVAKLGSRELGVDPERLEIMRAEQRADYLLQKRVEWVRGMRT